MAQYARIFLNINENINESIYDGSGLNHYLRNKTGSLMRGTTVSDQFSSNRGTNTSFISAITNNELIYAKNYTRNIDSTKFIEFMNKLVPIRDHKYHLGILFLFLIMPEYIIQSKKNLKEEKNTTVLFFRHAIIC